MSQVGDTVRYIKTHEGHLCRVTGVVANEKGQIIKLSVRCQCGAALLLNPKDVQRDKQ